MDKNKLKLYEQFKKDFKNKDGLISCSDVSNYFWDLIQEGKKIDSNSEVLREFVEKFFAYEERLELEIEYTKSILNAISKNANLVTFLQYRKKFNRLEKTYFKLGYFHVQFYKIFGISLTRTKSLIEIENNTRELGLI